MRTRVAALLLAFIPCFAAAQSWPAKPIRMIVPYPPGGIDVYARVMLPRLNEVLGQPVVLDNRGGANGFIGTELAARAAPDGYTLLWAAASTMVHGVVMSRSVPFDVLKDFTPVSGPLFENIRVITVHASLPVSSIGGLIEHAKRNPGKLSYASSGIGSVFHMDGEIFKRAAGVDILHVPYKGSGPMTTDLVSGRIEVGIASLNNVLPSIGAGKLRLLAIMEPKRSKWLPDTPALAETYPGLRKSPAWTGIFGPAGLPRPIVERVHAAVVETFKAPDVAAFHAKNQTSIELGGPDDLGAALRRDLEVTAKLVKAIGIQPE